MVIVRSHFSITNGAKPEHGIKAGSFRMMERFGVLITFPDGLANGDTVTTKKEHDWISFPVAKGKSWPGIPVAVPPCQTRIPCMNRSVWMEMLCDTTKERPEVFSAFFTCQNCHEKIEEIIALWISGVSFVKE